MHLSNILPLSDFHAKKCIAQTGVTGISSSPARPSTARATAASPAAIPDGRGVHMIDGKMQDDATWKQCRVMVDLAEMLARKDPDLAEAYEMQAAPA